MLTGAVNSAQRQWQPLCVRCYIGLNWFQCFEPEFIPPRPRHRREVEARFLLCPPPIGRTAHSPRFGLRVLPLLERLPSSHWMDGTIARFGHSDGAPDYVRVARLPEQPFRRPNRARVPRPPPIGQTALDPFFSVDSAVPSANQAAVVRPCGTTG